MTPPRRRADRAVKINVTGHLDTDDLDAEHVDLDHPMGLSSAGYEYWSRELPLDDADFTLDRG
ncbi:hypothetical protein GCM10023226_17240 [Nocardioides nanhaiensis]|uniref:Uncharacterized protein n=1 Tax=Nocardioides nanhaiensis TaxID=1476871 RepID=A0ABP8W6W2_9ACTN